MDELDSLDLLVNVYKTGGVAAVTVTHIPTGISASCSYYKSGLKNKAVCIRVIKEKLENEAQDS